MGPQGRWNCSVRRIWTCAFASPRNQQQQFFAVTDLNVSPVWEINFGVSVGATTTTDHLIVKAILGRRFDWGRHSAID